MSGVPFLVRISATLGSRLASSPSPSSASSLSCRQARRGNNIGRPDRRSRRSAGWKCKSTSEARLYTSQSILDPLFQPCGRDGARLRFVRAWSSTSTSYNISKRTSGDEVHKDSWSGETATSVKPAEQTNVVNQAASSFAQQSPARNSQIEFSDDRIVDYKPNSPLETEEAVRESMLDYKVLLKQALGQQRTTDIFKAIVAAGDDAEYIRSIPDTTFSEILRLIQPEKAIQWAKTVCKSCTPNMIGFMQITPPNEAVRTYLYAVLKVVTNRTKAGRHLNVNDYAILLATAHRARSKNVAKALWQSMQSEQVVPDLRCYNHYLGAIINNAGNGSIALHRVTPFNMRARSYRNRGRGYVDYAAGEGGIKEECLALLDQMLLEETSPDAETYSSIIIATAREGDIGMVERILQTAWGVDVYALMGNVDESQLSPRTDLKYTSPLYPTANVLYAIAHAFSINNNISTALRVVDYVSRTFDLTVSYEIWEELFTWTFVLTIRQTAREKFTEGQLSKFGLLELWKTMTNPPYNIQPSIPMYDKLLKSLLSLWRTRDMWHCMEEAHVLVVKHRSKTFRALQALKDAAELHTSTEGISTVSYEELRARYIKCELIRKRNALMERRWLRLLLSSMISWRKVDKDLFWSTIQIPTILLKMRHAAPRFVRYEIPGGRVSIVFHNNSEIRRSHKKGLEQTREKERLVNLEPSPPGGTLQMGRSHFRRLDLEKKPDE